MRTIGRHLRSNTRAKAAVALAGAVAGVHLVSQLAKPDSLLSDITQVMLMPALGAALLSLADLKHPLVRGTAVALFFSWIGDTAPRLLDGDVAFLSLVAAFLVAQVAYIEAFWPYRGSARPWNEWLPRLPYIGAFVALVAWCAPGAGAMVAPIAIYGTALALMAILATGVSGTAGVGGAIFLISDSLIAIHAFTDLELANRSFWVMSTYIAAQALIVSAVVDLAAGDNSHASR